MQLFLKGQAHRLLAFRINAHNLLTDRRAAARDDTRLGNRRPLGVAQQAFDMHPIVSKDLFETAGCRIGTEQTDSVDVAAQRRDVVDDIGRAARDDFFTGLLQNEHRCLTRNARDASIEIDIGHHITDDEDFLALHPRQYRIKLLLQHFHPFLSFRRLHRQETPFDLPRLVAALVMQDDL